MRAGRITDGRTAPCPFDVLGEPVRRNSTGSAITYITDTSGTHIEIVQQALLGRPGLSLPVFALR
jgi:hypothetical protein